MQKHTALTALQDHTKAVLPLACLHVALAQKIPNGCMICALYFDTVAHPHSEAYRAQSPTHYSAQSICSHFCALTFTAVTLWLFCNTIFTHSMSASWLPFGYQTGIESSTSLQP